MLNLIDTLFGPSVPLTYPDIKYTLQGAEGSLEFFYEKQQGELETIKFVKNKTISDIAKTQIWINNCPANFIADFYIKLLPKTNEKIEKIGEDFFLTFNEKELEKAQFNLEDFTFKFCNEDTDRKIRIFSDMPFRSIKIAIQQNLFKNNRNYSHFKLSEYYFTLNDFEIPDYFYLKKYRNENYQLELGKTDRNDPYLQGASKSEYSSLHNFENWSLKMIKSANYVCRIKTLYKSLGTGFMIGNNLIITCHHVLRDYIYENRFNTEIKAGFFEKEENSATSINVRLEKIVQCNQEFDFCIVTINIDSVDSLDNRYKLITQTHFASNFFENVQVVNIRNKGRANIIQYPEKQDQQKMIQQIAFRDNRVTHAQINYLHYESATTHCSSGSPAIDDEGRLIGMHVASCKSIEEGLFIFRVALNAELLKIQKENNQGHVIHIGKQDKYKIINLIKDVLSGENNSGNGQALRNKQIYEAKNWAIDFLKRQNYTENLEEHLFCNMAIPIKIIKENCSEEVRNLIIKKIEYPRKPEVNKKSYTLQNYSKALLVIIPIVLVVAFIGTKLTYLSRFPSKK